MPSPYLEVRDDDSNIGKRSSLLQYGINYGREKLQVQVLRCKFFWSYDRLVEETDGKAGEK